MPDRTPGGKPVDKVAQRAQLRNARYNLHVQEGSLMKQQNQILDAEENLDRMKEAVKSLGERIAAMRVEFAQLEGEKIDGRPE